MKILITGGAGYIGSTICAALEDAGHTPLILDSLVTGRIEFTRDRIFYNGDIADKPLVRQIFADHADIYAVIHCAALIIVPESTLKPYDYYRENVGKSLELFHTLKEMGHQRLVFSSSAAIYDVVPDFMVTESAPLKPTSPYARTKYMMEMILRDFCGAYGMRGIALRYFNPIGADPQMRSGIHVEHSTHVLGKMMEAAQGRLEAFEITGTDRAKALLDWEASTNWRHSSSEMAGVTSHSTCRPCARAMIDCVACRCMGVPMITASRCD